MPYNEPYTFNEKDKITRERFHTYRNAIAFLRNKLSGGVTGILKISTTDGPVEEAVPDTDYATPSLVSTSIANAISGLGSDATKAPINNPTFTGTVTAPVISGNVLNVFNVKSSPYNAVGNGVATDTTAIQNAITAAGVNGGIVYFPTGVYLTGPLTVPSNVTLYGSMATVKMAAGAGTLITATDTTNVKIEGLILDGGSTTSYVLADVAGTRNGILFTGTQVDQTNIVTNCVVKGFDNIGIRLDSQGVMSTDHRYSSVSNVYISHCYIGIYLPDRSEYHVLTGLSIDECHTGILNASANNRVGDSSIRYCVYGARILGTVGGVVSVNTAHTTWTGTSFNHCSNYALYIEDQASGFGFVGCNFEVSTEIRVINSIGVRFNGCGFAGTKLNISTGSGHVISGNVFRSTGGDITLDTVGASIISSNSFLTGFVGTFLLIAGGEHLFTNNYSDGAITISNAANTDSLSIFNNTFGPNATGLTHDSLNMSRSKVGNQAAQLTLSQIGLTSPNLSSVYFNLKPGTFGFLGMYGNAHGGLQIGGVTAAGQNAGAPLFFNAIHGGTAPSVTAIHMASWKHDGTTGRAALAAAEKVFELYNGATNLLSILGSGIATFASTVRGNTATGITTSSAVVGVASGAGTGIYGDSSTGNGLHGVSAAGVAVRASTTSGVGVYGQSTSNNALEGASVTGRGIYAQQYASPNSGAIGANTLHLSRTSTPAANNNVTGDLIYGNDAAVVSGTGTRTGNLLRLQKDGINKAVIDLDGNATLYGILSSKQSSNTVQALTYAATVAWNMNSGSIATLVLTDNAAMGAPTNIVAGTRYILRITQDATGSRTLTWNAVYKFPGAIAPVLSSTASAVDIVEFIAVDSTNLLLVNFIPDVR